MNARQIFPSLLRPLRLIPCLVLAAASLLHAQTPGKPSDARLSGTPFDNTKWQATPNLTLSSSPVKQEIKVNDSANFMGRLPVPAGAKRISVETTLLPGPTAGWLAVGIGEPPLGSPPWGLGAFVIITKDGHYTLAGSNDPNDWESKKIIRLKGGALPEFTPGGKVRLRLDYDAAGQALSLSVNEVLVIEQFDLAKHGVTVRPTYIGFSGLGYPAGHVIVEKFGMTTGD